MAGDGFGRHPRSVPPDLPALAEAVAAWADAHPHIGRACLIGSRVRGDHRPDSDLDVVAQPPRNGMGDDCLRWWLAARKSDAATAEAFGPLREAIFPVPLHLAHAPWDPAQGWADNAALDPRNVVLRDRKAVCLWTPPRGNMVT